MLDYIERKEHGSRCLFLRDIEEYFKPFPKLRRLAIHSVFKLKIEKDLKNDKWEMYEDSKERLENNIKIH